MNFTLTIDHELKIIRYKHVGVITQHEEIGEVWQQLLAMEEFTKLGYNLLSDYREARFKFPPNVLHEIVAYLGQLEPILRGKKQSILITDPGSTAYSIMFESAVYQAIGFRVKVFSTEQGAIRYVTEP